MKRILITGGAGFVGSSLAILFKQNFLNLSVVALDNLHRRGSELILRRLRDFGVEFVHGDVRVKGDFEACGDCDVVFDCAAEPSVLAGFGTNPSYVVDTNLGGTLNCLEYARTRQSVMVFLSTSRVYPISGLNNIPVTEGKSRFLLDSTIALPGLSQEGIAENFSLEGVRSIYGASKLASELLIREYAESYKFPCIINRCGILTGPWQMGKTDQGVIVLWMANHVFRKELSYIGFGGTGKQVRDMLHVADLFDLLILQLKRLEDFSGEVFNVGGGIEASVSLQELTGLCREVTGNSIAVSSIPDTRPNDVKWYISDCRRVKGKASWKPKRNVLVILSDINEWVLANRVDLLPILS